MLSKRGMRGLKEGNSSEWDAGLLESRSGVLQGLSLKVETVDVPFGADGFSEKKRVMTIAHSRIDGDLSWAENLLNSGMGPQSRLGKLNPAVVRRLVHRLQWGAEVFAGLFGWCRLCLWLAADGRELIG